MKDWNKTDIIHFGGEGATWTTTILWT
jgi:hypothetical protein